MDWIWIHSISLTIPMMLLIDYSIVYIATLSISICTYELHILTIKCSFVFMCQQFSSIRNGNTWKRPQMMPLSTPFFYLSILPLPALSLSFSPSFPLSFNSFRRFPFYYPLFFLILYPTVYDGLNFIFVQTNKDS